MSRWPTVAETVALYAGPAQALYDAIVKHALTMEGQCVDEAGCCANRSADGAEACFFGATIAPSLLVTPDDERALVPRTLHVLGIDDQHQALVEDLQSVHDTSLSWRKKGGLSAFGRRRLRQVRKVYGLTVPPDLLEPAGS